MISYKYKQTKEVIRKMVSVVIASVLLTLAAVTSSLFGSGKPVYHDEVQYDGIQYEEEF